MTDTGMTDSGMVNASDNQGQPLAGEELRRAIEVANLPTLLMVLFQLTGDEKWLRAPFLPTKTRGLDLHDDGGLPEDVQREIRAATYDALLAWSAGTAPAIPAPEGELLVRMMGVCMGEEVEPDYAPMMAEDMGFAAGGVRRPVTGEPHSMSVVVIGAGVSGLLASMNLKQAGIPHVVLEKSDEPGGTWLDNRYPGCGVDTPSYLYTFSFLPNNWSTYFGKRDEVWNYFAQAARRLNLQQNIRYGVEVLAAHYDRGAREWAISARNRAGKSLLFRATSVVSAVGMLNVPAVPEIAGAETFGGEIFHSAHWPADLDVTGKRVAVVGTGASAMQIVPAIAGKVAELTVYQRSPQWAAPSSNYFSQVPHEVHALMNHVPFYLAWYRFRLAWTFNDKVHPSLIADPDWPHPERSLNAFNEGHRRYLTRYIAAELDGRPDLLEKALPTYPPYGKRMLLDNGWFRALRRDDVHLVTGKVATITPGGVVTDAGEERAADVIVYATGFQARRLLGQFEVRGEDGRSLREEWGDDDAFAHLGITVPGYPNFFLMYGPNTNTGHGGSYIWTGECQIRYIVDLLCAMVERGIASVDVRRDVCDEYNRKVDEAHSKMIWSHGGMQTYYRNARGRVVTNSPWRIVDYWRMTHEADLDEYICRPAVESPLAAAVPSTSHG